MGIFPALAEAHGSPPHTYVLYIPSGTVMLGIRTAPNIVTELHMHTYIFTYLGRPRATKPYGTYRPVSAGRRRSRPPGMRWARVPGCEVVFTYQVCTRVRHRFWPLAPLSRGHISSSLSSSPPPHLPFPLSPPPPFLTHD